MKNNEEREIPDYFVWNIGVMMYYFKLTPRKFCAKMPVQLDENIFNKFQGGNQISLYLTEDINSLEYNNFSDEDKKKFDILISSIIKDKIITAYSKVVNKEYSNITVEEKFLILIKRAFNQPKELQFNVTRRRNYQPLVDEYFATDDIVSSEENDLTEKNNTLSSGRKLSEAYFKKIHDRGRFKSYTNTENERIVIKNKLKTSKNSSEYDLSELVFSPPKGINKDCSISLHGIGGTGKTFQLLSLYDLILHPENPDFETNKLPVDLKTIIPLYLELNDIRTNDNNCILYELVKRLEVESDVLINILSEQGSNVILMLDGYNEVTDGELREEIAKRICDIRRDYKTRIVITSRLDHSDMFNRINRGETAVFTQAEIQPLSQVQIDEYFGKIKVHNKTFHDLNTSEQRLVRTAQGLSMFGALLKKDSEKHIENLGMLLREYVNKIVLEEAENTEFEVYLEEIAYHMVLNGWFEITPDNLKKILDDKYIDVISNSFVKKLLIVDTKNNFEFSHQNIRDMYCALYFNKLISDINTNINCFTTNNVTINDEILVLCGNLIKNDTDIQKSINELKSKSYPNYSFILSVLIKIFAFRNENNIHTLDLEGLDLSEVSLSGYILYQKQYNPPDENGRVKINISSVKLDNTTVSEDTFENNGLKRGASTICKYTKDNVEYIIAFCSDNLIIYNTDTMKWQSIRYQFEDPKKKFGWINCVCHLKDEKKIIIGTDNGYITFFSYSDEPYINTDSDKFLKYNESCKHNSIKYGRSIESIISIKNKASFENILIASNSAGAVFVLNSDIILSNTSDKEITEVRESFKQVYNEDDFSICKLVTSDKYMFYSWGNKIFRQKLATQCETFMEWKQLKQKCIFDMYCTATYLFVNTGKEILVLSVDKGQILDSYSYSGKGNGTRQDIIKRFTKISGFDNRSDKVLIGITPEDQDRNTVPNYIVLTVEEGGNEDGGEEFFIKHYPVFGIEQTMTTFKAVSFTQDNHTFIATTSNDRSVQILSVDQEDFKAIRHLGNYDGIHHIEPISSSELLLSQYDGSVSHWKYITKSQEWRCLDVYPIHNDWVWKTKYYKDTDNNEFFFSCSYDGTVKKTNMKTYETEILIEDDDKIIDLALIESNGKLSAVFAVTTDKIISFNMTSKEKTEVQFYDNDNLHEKYPSYAIKSVTPGILKDYGTVLIAVNFYANNKKGLSNKARIYSLSSNSKIHLFEGINQDNTDDFESFTKIEELKTQNDSLIITGQKLINKNRTEQITVYTETSKEQLDFSKIKSSADLKERRIICTTIKDEQIFIGCLDGSVFNIDYNDSLEKDKLIDWEPAFLTHANLVSIFPVKMENVNWTDEQQRYRFKGYFKNL
ncbi:MAG: hypothetical protein K2I00_10015 [Ruminococcus sp.]|nr:hypothetical protein [Ruminococcus sp.]